MNIVNPADRRSVVERTMELYHESKGHHTPEENAAILTTQALLVVADELATLRALLAEHRR